MTRSHSNLVVASLSDAHVEALRSRCRSPVSTDCTNQTVNAKLDFSMACTVNESAIASKPTVDTAWPMCTSGVSAELCTRQKAACELSVEERNTQSLVMVMPERSMLGVTEKLASYVRYAKGKTHSCHDAPQSPHNPIALAATPTR